jgi:hypothetical protein
LYFQYIPISFSRISIPFYDYSTLIVLSSKNTGIFEIAPLNTPFPYVGVSVGTVTQTTFENKESTGKNIHCLNCAKNWYRK